MNIVDPNINSYLSDLLPTSDPVLHEMEKHAEERRFPIVGPLVGRLCWQQVKVIGAKRVFEMGSGFGYSAYWIAMALPQNGRIICTEKSEDNIKLGQEFFKRGGLSDKVEFHQGDALELIQQFEGQFDVILNDIDKEGYPEALEIIAPRLRSGGLLISDNLLWHGRVLDARPDSATEGVLKYNQSLYASREFWTVVLPLRDGVGLSLKL